MHCQVVIESNYKMLCSSDKFSLYCKGLSLFYKEKNGSILIFIGRFEVSMLERVLSRFKISRRVLRLEPRCGLFLSEDVALVSYKGRIFRVELRGKRIIYEHSFRKGMNNPLVFTRIEDIEGFDDCIVYGEYVNCETDGGISIVKRYPSGNWKEVYVFPPKRIKHIHNIVVSKRRNSLLVLTGDTDDESGIWEFKNNFNSVRQLVGGSQMFRVCAAFPFKNGLVYATDAPMKQNYIYYLTGEEGKELVRIREINGPCIYGNALSDKTFVFSTSVEQSANIRGPLKWISLKRAIGVKNMNSYIYVGNPDEGFSEVFSARKDNLPFMLCGYGTFLFPHGVSKELIAVGQAIKKLDGKTIKFSLINND